MQNMHVYDIKAVAVQLKTSSWAVAKMPHNYLCVYTFRTLEQYGNLMVK